VAGWAVADGQAAADEVVLDVDDDEAAHRTHDLWDFEVVRISTVVAMEHRSGSGIVLIVG
jgi:hypothetical protein